MNHLELEVKTLLKNDNSIFSFIEQNVVDGILYWDIKDPNRFWLNDTFWDTLGYNVNSTLPKWESIVNFEDVERARVTFKHHLEKSPNSPYRETVRYTHNSGQTIWLQCNGIVLYDDNQQPNRLLGTYSCITNQKETEEAYKNVIDAAYIGTWESNLKTGISQYNERWAEIIGYTVKELGTMGDTTWQDFVHPDDLDVIQEATKVYQSGKNQSTEIEFRMKHKEGHWVWVLSRGKVIKRQPDGSPLLIAGSHYDISVRKKNELLLKKYKDELERSNKMASIGSWEINLSNNTVHWSNTLKDILEVPCHVSPKIEEIIDYYPEGNNRSIIQEAVNNAIENNQNFDIVLQVNTYKKQLKWIRIIGLVDVTEDQQKHIYGLFQDIDEIKKTQIQLALKEEEFKQTFWHSIIGVCLINLKGKIVRANPSLCNILGYSETELQKINFQELSHPDDLEPATTLLKEIIQGNRENFQIEKRYYRKDGKIIWVKVSTSAVKNNKGEVTHVVGQAQDITENKQLTENLKEHNNRLLNFAHIVSHNLRSHTGNISMLLDINELESNNVIDDEIYELLKTASQNMSETVEHLTSIVEINSKLASSLEAINLHQVITKIAHDFHLHLKSFNCKLEIKVDKNITVMAIPAYLESIILNLITNAIKYRSKKRTPKIKIESGQDKNFIYLKVIDNGIGIDLDLHRESIFGMYKTFHNHEEARGVGLFITKNQIEAMGGRIDVESQLKKGTTFTVYFKTA